MRSRLPLNGTVRPPRTRIEWILAETDGVASRQTLRSRRVDEAELDVAAFYGHVQSIARGWWAMVGAHPGVLAARLAGGRLACRSALAYYGGGGSGSSTSGHSDGGDADAGRRGLVHVEVPRSASRLGEAPGVVRHWIGDPIGLVRRRGERENVVPLEVAVRQARRCGAPESAR